MFDSCMHTPIPAVKFHANSKNKMLFMLNLLHSSDQRTTAVMNMEQGDELEMTEDTQELNAAVHTPKYWMNSTSMSGE